jgi:hypothetical protein
MRKMEHAATFDFKDSVAMVETDERWTKGRFEAFSSTELVGNASGVCAAQARFGSELACPLPTVFGSAVHLSAHISWLWTLGVQERGRYLISGFRGQCWVTRRTGGSCRKVPLD